MTTPTSLPARALKLLDTGAQVVEFLTRGPQRVEDDQVDPLLLNQERPQPSLDRAVAELADAITRANGAIDRLLSQSARTNGSVNQRLECGDRGGQFHAAEPNGATCCASADPGRSGGAR